MKSLLLTHGAGSNRNAPLLVAVERALPDIHVVRYDLSFRQQRPKGPPRPGDAAHDRSGLKEQITMLRARNTGEVYIGGVSYGGRQASMLVSEEPELVDGLFLLSYPLHAPGKPDRPRMEHLPGIRTPVLFVHGSRDPFGSLEEIEGAIRLIPARTRLVPVQGAGHDLKGAAPIAAAAFQEFFP
jgi:predicted alpha/beta-hydrolase family hydrolase